MSFLSFLGTQMYFFRMAFESVLGLSGRTFTQAGRRSSRPQTISIAAQ